MHHLTPSLYFIGDSPLCFDSEIATLFLKSIAPTTAQMPQYIGLAGLRRTLWTVLDETTEPALFKMHRDRASFSDARWLERAKNDPFYFVDRHHAEGDVIWHRGVLPWLECNIDRNLPTLMDGVGLLPQYLATFDTPHKAVFVGTTKPAREDYRAHVEEIRIGGRDHWMRTWSSEKVDAYLTYILPAYGSRLRELCQKHGYTFFDYAEADDYRVVQRRAANFLAG